MGGLWYLGGGTEGAMGACGIWRSGGTAGVDWQGGYSIVVDTKFEGHSYIVSVSRRAYTMRSTAGRCTKTPSSWLHATRN